MSTLTKGVMAGSLCPPVLMERTEKELGIKGLTIAYGQTETSPANCMVDKNDPYEKKITTVGKPHPHIEIKIVDAKTGKLV